jgi:hypothetical protein
MKKFLAWLVMGIFLLGVTGAALASSAGEAAALVDKASAFYKANGKEKALEGDGPLRVSASRPSVGG